MKLITLVMVFFSLGSFASEPTVVYLVRHAEKIADGSKDPSLSEVGQARAAMLKYFFEKVPLTKIYATQFKRTKETVASIGDDHQLAVEVIQAQDPQSQIKAIQNLPGGCVLVAGHSNTIPALIHLLGGPQFEISESEYDGVFMVILDGGKAQFQHFQMHAPTAH